MNLIVSAIGQGLLWGLLGLGLFLTFRILKFPDMTVEGTFPFGACVCVALITNGVSPILATVMSFVAGLLTGLTTGLLYTKGKIPILLAGILVMTGIYSINLHVLGKATVGLLNEKTLLTSSFMKSLPTNFPSVVLGLILVSVIIFFLALFFNPLMARALGINTDNMEILGLMISNGLIGLCGGLIAQNDGYADVNMGVGTIVIGLAAIIIGEVAYGELSLTARLVAVILGSIFYRFVLLIVLKLGFSSNDFKLLASLILALCLMLPLLERKFSLVKILKKGVQKP